MPTTFEDIRDVISDRSDDPDALAAWLYRRFGLHDKARARASDISVNVSGPQADNPDVFGVNQPDTDVPVESGTPDYDDESDKAKDEMVTAPNSAVPWASARWDDKRKPAHDANPADMAFDWRGVAVTSDPAVFAFDRDSVRQYTPDGHLKVADANLSKAAVNPYWGKEIPDYEQLGLDPDRQYLLLRHPDEIASAVGTFNNLPILSTHQPITADEYPPELVVGTTGDSARFEDGYLRNSLALWSRDAIEAVEGNRRKELSCGYRYTADMTPGVWQGQRYDGVMRNLHGNHVALVKEGRAGADCVVSDAANPGLRWFRYA